MPHLPHRCTRPDGADVTFEALQLVALATELMPFGVPSPRVAQRDSAATAPAWSTHEDKT